MRELSPHSGFSLVEILVSLFIVCLVAVNISGLQKMVSDQSRDNFYHLAVIKLVTGKFEEIKKQNNMQNIIDLNNSTLTHTEHDTIFLLQWNIAMVSGASMTSPIRDVQVTITWPDARGETQTFIYSELISLMMLLRGVGDEQEHFSYQIPNLLETNNINYFDSKLGYEIDAYVIYNSQLFKATTAHFPSNDGIDFPVNNEGVVSGGWENLGQVDNSELSSLFAD
jgi:prepilin-type N-terminal cleavage/methylation domain-containing protein